MSAVYVFSSENLTNVWAAVGARLWAVSEAQGANQSNVTKSQKVKVGEFGIFHVKETKAFTTPFVIRSRPREGAGIANVWKDIWYLPFAIVPLGSPHVSIPAHELDNLLPSLVSSRKHWDQVLFVAPNTVFAPAKITAEDWAVLVEKLVEK
jgi:hypothetical protein